LDADRSQRRYDRGFSALACHFLRGAAECPSEGREPDNRERNSADHCTPYRWFHPGMDLHFVTCLWEKGASPVSTNESYRAASPRYVASETTQAAPAPLECRIPATVLVHHAAGCRARQQPRSAASL